MYHYFLTFSYASFTGEKLDMKQKHNERWKRSIKKQTQWYLKYNVKVSLEAAVRRCSEKC